MNFANAEPMSHALKFAIARFGTGQTFSRMIGEDKFHHSSSRIDDPHRMGLNDAALAHFGATGRSQVALSAYFYNTYSATSGFIFDVHVV
jgi:hypothetical protein